MFARSVPVNGLLTADWTGDRYNRTMNGATMADMACKDEAESLGFRGTVAAFVSSETSIENLMPPSYHSLAVINVKVSALYLYTCIELYNEWLLLGWGLIINLAHAGARLQYS